MIFFLQISFKQSITGEEVKVELGPSPKNMPNSCRCYIVVVIEIMVYDALSSMTKDKRLNHRQVWLPKRRSIL